MGVRVASASEDVDRSKSYPARLILAIGGQRASRPALLSPITDAPPPSPPTPSPERTPTGPVPSAPVYSAARPAGAGGLPSGAGGW